MPPKRLFAVVAVVLVLMASMPARASTFTISMRGGGSPNFFFFGNDQLIVVVGDTVRWVNSSDAEHTVTAYRNSQGVRAFDSSENTPDTGPCTGSPLGAANDCVQPGQEYSFTFDQPGTFNYFCKIHSQTGAETVKPAPSRSAQNQPCGMCAVIEVRTATTQRPGSSGGSSGSGSSGGSVPKPKPSKSARATPTPTATPTTDGSALGSSEDGGGGGGGKTALALLVIVALSGAGYMIWRKFLVVR
jgi:plastocyanin